MKVAEKSNEIVAIPKLLDMLAIEGAIVTVDAMGSLGGAQFSWLAEVRLLDAPESAPPMPRYEIMAWGRPGD